MFGLAKKADTDIAGLITQGIRRIPQMDDLAGLAIVANGKKRQAQSQNQNQSNDEQNPPELKNQ